MADPTRRGIIGRSRGTDPIQQRRNAQLETLRVEVGPGLDLDQYGRYTLRVGDGLDIDGDGILYNTATDGSSGRVDAEDVSFTPAGSLASADVQAALQELDSEKSAVGHSHGLASVAQDGFMSMGDFSKLQGIESGATADQVASEVPFTPAGSLSSTNVQDAIEELESEMVSMADDQDASEVPFTPAGTLAATDVQEALEEVDTTTGRLGRAQYRVPAYMPRRTTRFQSPVRLWSCGGDGVHKWRTDVQLDAGYPPAWGYLANYNLVGSPQGDSSGKMPESGEAWNGSHGVPLPRGRLTNGARLVVEFSGKWYTTTSFNGMTLLWAVDPAMYGGATSSGVFVPNGWVFESANADNSAGSTFWIRFTLTAQGSSRVLWMQERYWEQPSATGSQSNFNTTWNVQTNWNYRTQDSTLAFLIRRVGAASAGEYFEIEAGNAYLFPGNPTN